MATGRTPAHWNRWRRRINWCRARCRSIERGGAGRPRKNPSPDLAIRTRVGGGVVPFRLAATRSGARRFRAPLRVAAKRLSRFRLLLLAEELVGAFGLLGADESVAIRVDLA